MNDIVCNTLVLSNCLQDNLEILSDQGLMVGKFKVTGRQFHIQLSKFLNNTYKKVDGDLDWLMHEIDTSVEISNKVFKMDLEKKQKVLKYIESL